MGCYKNRLPSTSLQLKGENKHFLYHTFDIFHVFHVFLETRWEVFNIKPTEVLNTGFDFMEGGINDCFLSIAARY